MTPFFFAKPITAPEGVRCHLADPEQHWRKSFSACELATAWINSKGLPPVIRAVLDGAPEYRSAALIEGYFERQVDLRTPGRASQTDLMVLLRLEDGHAIMAVEGKVNESFDNLVKDLDRTPGRERRLDHLRQVLGIPSETVGEMRYQLLHRTASALFEAERYGFDHAVMLVHSFSQRHAGFNDFARFASALEIPVAAVNAISEARRFGSVDLRLAWVADRPAP
jgi:hypothetical protein